MGQRIKLTRKACLAYVDRVYGRKVHDMLDLELESDFTGASFLETFQRVMLKAHPLEELTKHQSFGLRSSTGDIAPARAILTLTIDKFTSTYYQALHKQPEMIHRLKPREFEELIADILHKMGCEIEITPQTHDGGRDILAAFPSPVGKLLTIVECKKYRPDCAVGINIVERFLYTLQYKDNASVGLIATTSYFSREVEDLARKLQWRLRLKDGEGIKDWISQYGTWKQGADSAIWTPKLVW